MKQFPSVTARRHNTFGHGIRSRIPEPTGTLIQCDPEQVVVEPPVSNPIVLASWLERFYRYSRGYEDKAARYTGEDAFSSSRIPARYSIGVLDENYYTLWIHYLQELDRPWVLPHRPWEGDSPDNTGLTRFGIVQSVAPKWSAQDEADYIAAHTSTGTSFLGCTQGIGGSAVAVGEQAFTVAYENGNPSQDFVMYPEVVTVTNEAVVGSRVVPIAVLALQLLIHGKCYWPNGVGGNGVWSPLKEIPTQKETWLRYIQGCAGRWLWQFAYIQWWMMHDDLCNVGEGGRGGESGLGYEDGGGSNPHLPPVVGPDFGTPGPLHGPTIPGVNSAGPGAIV